MPSYPLCRTAHRFNKPSWLMAPDASTLPAPAFNGTASFNIQTKSLVIVHATIPIPSCPPPSTDSCVFPPPPTYAESMAMDDDLPLAEAMRRARAMDPEGYVAEAIHPKDRLPPSFDDIARMEPHLPWEEVMKRAGNIDQAALIRDTISRESPDGLEASFERPSEVSSLLGPRTASHRPTTSMPEPNFDDSQSSMYTEEAMTSLSLLSSNQDKINKELKAFSKYITIWLHTTITKGSRTQPTTDSASVWKAWSTFSETVTVIQAIIETLTLDHITIFHALVYIRRLFGGYYIDEDEAYLENTPNIIAQVFFAGCLLGFKYCQDDYSVRSWASTIGIDRRTMDTIGRHALQGLDYRLDISPNNWKASLEDLRRFAASCSFSAGSSHTRTVVNNILEGLKIDAPPGIPLRARTNVSQQGSTKPPSLTNISGIFTGAEYIPHIIAKAALRNVPNDSMMERDRKQIGEHLLSMSVQHPGIWNGQGDYVSGRVAIGHSARLETHFSMQGASARNRQTLPHAQRIRPNDVSFSVQGNMQNDLPIRHGAAMMVGRDIRLNVRFLETQSLPLASRSLQDHRMIWHSDNRISGQRPVSGGLFLRGPDETNIWAPQRGENPGDTWFTQQGNQIASGISLLW
ncbi:hypothetical protein IW261DRAFT_1562353 [Armillaria novae-zelandiae]|uniref:Uncharacterized protein n=1 Tax=Armillaria novae-zelandiae TaxID=153914 RepID=A0AA39PE97_9AGAR|nr:hypothetical protein IW261DRAFT_1562353 [Armillaria novae-zelandiae]